MAREKDAAAPAGRGRDEARQARAADLELGSYFRQLQRHLGALERAELVERLVAYAGRLAAGERERLLAVLAAEPESGSRAARSRARGTKRAPAAADPTLPDDVASFVVALERGEYVHGWGWDDDLGEERMWGDESWALDMDVLFSRADEAFFVGDLEVAREALGGLLRAFVSEPAIEGFCGPEPPEDMLDADVSEAKARYFRAIYLTESAEARAETLLEAAQELVLVGSEEVGIRAMADADAPPLPDQDAFLDAWTAALEVSASVPMSGWSRLRKWLLREAAERRGGMAGIEALAQRDGARHPEAYGDWMQALSRQGRVAEALAAGREGLGAIAEAAGRAWFADAVADLAARHPEVDPRLVFDAAHSAWRAQPTTDRLLRLYGCRTDGADARERLIEAELGWLEGLDPPPAASLLARLELLAGRFRAAASRLREAPQLGWSGAGHPGRVAVPGLLGAALGPEALPPPGPSRLAELWEAMDRTAGPAGSPSDIAAPAFSQALTDTLRRRPLPPSQVDEMLTLLAAVARDRVEAIVRAQYRGAYARAAGLLTACAEGQVLAGRSAEARRLIEGMRLELGRYYAFRGELDAAVASSALLGPDYVPLGRRAGRRRKSP